jgi:hypothetical protein
MKGWNNEKEERKTEIYLENPDLRYDCVQPLCYLARTSTSSLSAHVYHSLHLRGILTFLLPSVLL